MINKTICFLFLSTLSINAFAYIGPGMAGGAIAAIVGILLSILAAIFAVLYYPIKRALKKKAEAAKNDEANRLQDDTTSK